ncbi:MAG: STAS domain-containing protein [Bacteroidaceae bacterium]|nr:STAS domain-containing protein [Bacteroidaceae bacterium]
MNTIIQQEGNGLRVIFEGRLDTAAATKTEQDIQPLFDFEGGDITLDCAKLEYVSSSGLRLFLALLKVTKAKNIHLYITGMTDDLRQVFDMTGFSSIFEFK